VLVSPRQAAGGPEGPIEEVIPVRIASAGRRQGPALAGALRRRGLDPVRQGCDGLTDDDDVTATWYEDADGDGDGIDADRDGESGYFPCSLAGAGDVDGDGRDDVLVGAVRNLDGGHAAGKAYLLRSAY